MNPIEAVPDTYTCTVAGSGCSRNGISMPDMNTVSRDATERDRKASEEKVRQEIHTVLVNKPEWEDAVISVYLNEESIRGYSIRIGANENNITQKLKRARKKLQEVFGNRQI